MLGNMTFKGLLVSTTKEKHVFMQNPTIPLLDERAETTWWKQELVSSKLKVFWVLILVKSPHVLGLEIWWPLTAWIKTLIEVI